MNLTDELLQLLSDVYEDGYHAACVDYQSASGVALTADEAAQKWLDKLRLEIRQCVSMGDERQIEDPRSKYIDVQVELDFYEWLYGGN